MILDIELRFVERIEKLDYGHVRRSRILQMRKLMKLYAGHDQWNLTWTEWSDVPLVEET